jgi:hypothetical protein
VGYHNDLAWDGIIADLKASGLPIEGLGDDAITPPRSSVLTDGQKGALDLFRATRQAWDEWRGDLPALPDLFALAPATGDLAIWARVRQMTPKQLQILQQFFEAMGAWNEATGGGDGQQQFAEAIKLYNPNHDARGRFAPGGMGGRHEQTAGRRGGGPHEAAHHTSGISEHGGGHGGGGSGGHAGGGVQHAGHSRTPAEHAHLLARVEVRQAQRAFDHADSAQRVARDHMQAMQSAHAATLARVHADIRAEALRRLPEIAPHAAEEVARLRSVAEAADRAKAVADDAYYRARRGDERMRADVDASVARGAAEMAHQAVTDAENRPIEAYVNRETARHPDVMAAHAARAAAEQHHAETLATLRTAGTRLSAAHHQASITAIGLRAERSSVGVSVVREPHADSALRGIFGRDLSDGEIALLGGAGRGDEVRVVMLHDHAVRVETTGADRTATFQLAGLPGHIVHSDAYVRNMGQKTPSSGMEVIKAFQTYRDLGITELTALAARGSGDRLHAYNGYSTWAKLGATGAIPDHVLPAAIARFGYHVRRVEDIMSEPGGAAWWKEHGDSFPATFDFREGSYTMKELNGIFRKLQERRGQAI